MMIAGVACVARHVWRHCPDLWQSVACGYDSRRSLCGSSCLAVVMANLEVLKDWFQTLRLLVLLLLINL